MDLIERLRKLGELAGGDGRASLQLHVNVKQQEHYDQISLFVSLPNGCNISESRNGRTLEGVFETVEAKLTKSALVKAVEDLRDHAKALDSEAGRVLSEMQKELGNQA